MNKKKSSGQTLLEVIIALSTAVVIISAIVVMVINGLNNAQFAKNQNLASNYAQQGMEIVRKTRDSNLYGFQNNYLGSGTYCLAKTDNSLPGRTFNSCPITVRCSLNIDNTFIREVCIDNSSDSTNNCPIPTIAPSGPINYVTQVTVRVSWSDSKCPPDNVYCHESKLVSCLSDFNAISTPTPTP